MLTGPRGQNTGGSRREGGTAGSLRILHVIDSGGLYGAEAVLLDLADEQRKLGHAPAIGSIASWGVPEKPLEHAARDRGLAVRPVRMLPGPNPFGVSALLRSAWRDGADVLHSHGYKGDILLGFVPLWLRRLPLVATVHGYTHVGGLRRMALYSWLDRRALHRIDRVVFVHESMTRKLELGRMDDSRWRVIENGIPQVSPLDSVELPDGRIAAFCRRRPTIGAVGRLSREKAFENLIAAVRDLVASGRDLQLVILGDGPERLALEKLVANWGLEERVLLPGYVRHARAYLALFRMFVLPSLTEGLPITLLEAMQAGVPIVATDVGGVREVLRGGRGGIIVEPANPRALREGVTKLLEDPDLVSRLSRFSLAEAAGRYSSRTMAERYIDLYREVIGKERLS